MDKDYEKTEDDLKALQSVGQIIGEVLKQLDDERFIVKASSGPRYVVGCRNKVDKDLLKPTARVALDMTTLTIMRLLPREVRPVAPSPRRPVRSIDFASPLQTDPLAARRLILWCTTCCTATRASRARPMQRSVGLGTSCESCARSSSCRSSIRSCLCE